MGFCVRVREVALVSARMIIRLLPASEYRKHCEHHYKGYAIGTQTPWIPERWEGRPHMFALGLCFFCVGPKKVLFGAIFFSSFLLQYPNPKLTNKAVDKPTVDTSTHSRWRLRRSRALGSTSVGGTSPRFFVVWTIGSSLGFELIRSDTMWFYILVKAPYNYNWQVLFLLRALVPVLSLFYDFPWTTIGTSCQKAIQ